jgi:hypothetical protein
MKRRLLQTALCIAAGLCAGCSSSPSVTTLTLHSPYFSSRDGNLQYRLPAGWFDATADSQAAGQVIWLLRNDYAATIAVSEIHLDAGARDAIRSDGVMHLAQLSMALASGGASYAITQQPEELRVNGNLSCVYALTTTPANDRLRVVLLDTGERVYMVTALVPEETKRGGQSEVFIVQDAFVGSLRW